MSQQRKQLMFQIMFTLQEVCRRTLFEPWVFTWLSEIRHFLQVRPSLWFTGSPPMALNITGFYTWCLCASVSNCRGSPWWFVWGTQRHVHSTLQICMGAAAGCCVGVHRMPVMRSLSFSVSTDSQREARNALAQSRCLERKAHCTALGSKVSNWSFRIILHLRRLSESGLHTPIKKVYWGYNVYSCI